MALNVFSSNFISIHSRLLINMVSTCVRVVSHFIHALVMPFHSRYHYVIMTLLVDAAANATRGCIHRCTLWFKSNLTTLSFFSALHCPKKSLGRALSTMRFTSLLAAVPFLSLVARAADPAHWSKLAAKSRDGVIKLDSKTYDDILALDREYSVTVLLTAIPAQYKCQPCQCVHTHRPSFLVCVFPQSRKYRPFFP